MSQKEPNTPPERNPNQTVSSTDDPELPPGVKAIPRDPNQPAHKRPRVFIHRLDEDPEEENQARKNTSYREAARTVQLSDFLEVHKMPCFRDAMLPGIAGGSGIGALRFVLGGSIPKSCNYASASFVGISIVMYELCQRRRQYDREGIRKAVKVLDEKQKMKEAEDKAQKETRQTKTNGGFWNTFKFW